MAKEERIFPGPWSDDEIALIKKLYAEKPTKELAKQLGRSLPAVRYRAHMLGLKRKIQYEGRWTPEDIALLKELYPECPLGEIAKRLGRTVNAVANRAHQLGIKRKSYLDKLWTAEELQLLSQLYPTHEGIQNIAERIGRSPAMVRAKAHKLGFIKHHRIYDL
jgi:Zn-dependent peptidase ImmA (M78 family)